MSEPGTRELDRAPFAPIAGSFVPCPLKGNAQIAAGRCVEWQQENGCHCEHALPSLRRVEKHLIEEPARKASPADVQLAIKEEQRLEQLEGVRALIGRAEAMELARPPPPKPAETHKAALEGMKANPVRCEIDGCGKELRVNNLSGLCQEHRQKVTSRQRVGLVAPAARAAGTAGDALQRIKPPAPPAKESSMGLKGPKSPLDAVSDTELRKAFEELGSVEKVRKKFSSAHATVARRLDELGISRRGIASKDVPAPAPKLPRRVNGKRRPRTLDDVAARHAPPSAPPADIIGLLQRQLDHHQEQADKCKRALAALQ